MRSSLYPSQAKKKLVARPETRWLAITSYEREIALVEKSQSTLRSEWLSEERKRLNFLKMLHQSLKDAGR